MGMCSPAVIPVESFAEHLRTGVDAIFEDDKVEIVIDAQLASKAITGSNRIRLRAGERYCGH
jgi:hypothetical protein